MGQARKRGTFDERKAMAVQRDGAASREIRERIIAEEVLQPRRRPNLSPGKRIALLTMAALAGLSAPGDKYR